MTKLSPSAQYAITVRLEYPHEPGWIAKVSGVIGDQGGMISAIDFVQVRRGKTMRDYTVECSSTKHAEEIIEGIKTISGVTVRSVSDETFLMHLGGKLEIRSKVPLNTRAARHSGIARRMPKGTSIYHV
jgi:malate dehydrogenase (oxaloacetate-decarboxylating)